MDLRAILELDKILSAVALYTQSECGKKSLLATNYSVTFDEAVVRQILVKEADLYLANFVAPIFPFDNIESQLKRLKKGAILDQEELFSLLKFLKAEKVLRQCQFQQNLNSLKSQFLDTGDFLNRLDKIFDDQGEIKDDATPSLKIINKQLHQLSIQVDKEVTRIAKTNSSYLQESVPVLRQNTLVLAVKISYVNHFGGNVIDYSDSMQTAFVEPEAVAALNKKIHQLQMERLKEILLLLADFSKEAATLESLIENNFNLLIEFDVIFAKAQWGKKYTYPELIQGDSDIVLAIHPLLEKPVANSIKIHRGRPIIISGPNAGGKSVLLKTTAIVFFLAQSGMAVPCSKAKVNVYQEIILEMGDQQSLQDSLSTFLAHLKGLNTICQKAGEGLLCLIDEIAKGTDPKEGEALALSIIEYLIKRKASVIVTTHYPSLRAFGLSGDHVESGSMQFASERLEPTFHYLPGHAGASYAFYLAQRAKLDESIVTRAKQLYEDALSSVEIKERQLFEIIAENNKRQKELQLQLEENRLLQDELVKTKKELNEIKADTQRRANEIIEELVENAKEEIIIRSAELNKSNAGLINKELDKLVVEQVREQDEVIDGEIAIGDYVLLSTLKQKGKIIKINADKALVDTGKMQVKVSLSTLEKIKQPTREVKVQTGSLVINSIAPELNLIGLRREEAAEELRSYLDRARALAIKEVRIIHGVGSGTLRNLVAETARAMKLELLLDKYSLGGASIIKL